MLLGSGVIASTITNGPRWCGLLLICLASRGVSDPVRFIPLRIALQCSGRLWHRPRKLLPDEQPERRRDARIAKIRLSSGQSQTRGSAPGVRFQRYIPSSPEPWTWLGNIGSFLTGGSVRV